VRRHRLDPVAGIGGLLMLGAAGAWWAWRHDLVSTPQLAYGVPVALVVIGATTFLISLLTNRPRPPTRSADTDTATSADNHTTDNHTDTGTDPEKETR